MRRIVTAITAAAMALSLVSMATPANAVAGYDSAYAGESAFLTLNAGQSGTFTVFFQNTGTTSWAKGTATQVDLAACNEDKVTCNSQDASEAPFASGWLSTTRYATHTQTTVAPGSIGTFTYNVAAPAGQAAGTYRFNGALVLSSTGADIHNEGYYQDVTVPTAVGSCTPTAITTTPTSAQNQVGVTHTQSATVTCAIPEGGTTAPASVGTQVTFVVDAATADIGNADQTLTATTDANGIATVTWTRSNPGTDSVSVYPTSTPAVRATATKRWTVAGAVITCTPTASATQLNGTARVYTVTLKNPSTGAAAATEPVDITISKRMSTGAGTINGVGILTTSGQVGTTVTTITTDSAGSAAFTVTGTGSVIAPRVFVESATFGGGSTADTLETGEFRADCGTTTFQESRAVFTVTPDTTATMALSGQRVYTVTAVDQFGSTYTGAADIGFIETTDDSSTTTTTAVISWTDTDSSRSTTASAGCGTASSGTTLVNAQSTQVTLVNGAATFAVCAASATTGTPVVWQDLTTNDNLRQTDEPQDTGGATTWATAALTAATMTPSSATNPTSSAGTGTTNEASFGEELFTFQLTDQSGNAFAPTGTSTVTLTVTNTGSGNLYIVATDGVNESTLVAAGTSTTKTITLAPGDGNATIELDAEAAGSASITGTLASNAAITATGTKTWVTAQAEPAPNGSTVTGTVVATDKPNDFYVVQTSGAGNFSITYAPTDLFKIAGSTTDFTTFETALSVGDVLTWTKSSTGVETHEITTNN